MRIYSCGNCGETLPGPDVYRCPHCGVLLRGTREGTEEERLRRQQEYRRNRPEAIERRRKIRETFENIGSVFLFIVVALLILALFIGGGAALGWFVFPLIFGYEARIPLLVSGIILLGALLYPIILKVQWSVDQGTKFVRGYGISRKPEWVERIEEEAEKKVYLHRLRSAWLLFFFLLISLPLLGVIGWRYAEYIFLAVIFGVLLLLYFWLKRHKVDVSFENFSLAAVAFLYGLSVLVKKLDLSYLPQPVFQHSGAFAGMLGGIVLAFYLAKRFAGPPPNKWELEHNAILAAVFVNPELLRDLPSETRQEIADELRTLLEASPQAWEMLSPALRRAFPELEPKPSSQKAEGKTSKKSGGKK
jgi:hypothetical protein